ncbi:MAG TPA: hypothetical protein VHO02_06240, partial [Fibrobacteria bacterium]|nr:hypothetical protein [Fibrobacteria bacterium]
MPWGWILCALLIPAGLLLLALALFHVRVRASWGGAWESLDSSQGGSFQVEYGFPGFMRKWDGAKNTEAVGSGLAEEDAGAWSDPVGSDVPPRNAK